MYGERHSYDHPERDGVGPVERETATLREQRRRDDDEHHHVEDEPSPAGNARRRGSGIEVEAVEMDEGRSHHQREEHEQRQDRHAGAVPASLPRCEDEEHERAQVGRPEKRRGDRRLDCPGEVAIGVRALT